MFFIIILDAIRVIKYIHGFIEAKSMFSFVYLIFFAVPFIKTFYHSHAYSLV